MDDEFKAKLYNLDSLERSIRNEINRLESAPSGSSKWQHAYRKELEIYPTKFQDFDGRYIVAEPKHGVNRDLVRAVEKSSIDDTQKKFLGSDSGKKSFDHSERLSFAGLKSLLEHPFDFDGELNTIIDKAAQGLLAAKPIFSVLKPVLEQVGFLKEFPEAPYEPKRSDFGAPKGDLLFKIFDIFSDPRAEAFLAAAKRYKKYYPRWMAVKSQWDKLESIRAKDIDQYESAKEYWETTHQKNEESFQNHLDAHLAFKDKQVTAAKELQKKYKSGDPSHVVEYFDLIYRYSPLPKIFPRNIEFKFEPKTAILWCSLELPNFNFLPLEKVARNKIQALNKGEKQEAYEFGLYATLLKAAHEFATADVASLVQKICINGWVTYIDDTDGHIKESIVLSALADRSKFAAMNLTRIDPKAAFRSLGGVASPRPAQYAPVLPVLKLDKNDGRLRESDFSAAEMARDTNLAAMDWEEFEHLVRELFSKEFSSETTTVKVTQASRDGGVDAIAYDDDPIRGGKFVIQAKRYTNTVDIAAVRELYAVVIDEGANRGLLVTTSSFGADSYDYVKNKPITLINGSELLGLLKGHGHSFRIDLEEARALNR